MYSYTIFNGSKLTDGSLKDYLKDVFCGYYLIDNMGNKEWLGAAYTTLEWNSSMAKLNSLRYFDERGYVNYRGGNDKYHFWEKYNSSGHSKTEMGFVLSLYCIQGPIDLAYNERVGCQFELFYRMDEMEKFKELKIQKDEDSF